MPAKARDEVIIGYQERIFHRQPAMPNILQPAVRFPAISGTIRENNCFEF